MRKPFIAGGVLIEGELLELAEKNHLKQSTIQRRIIYGGWKPIEAVSIPIGQKRPQESSDKCREPPVKVSKLSEQERQELIQKYGAPKMTIAERNKYKSLTELKRVCGVRDSFVNGGGIAYWQR